MLTGSTRELILSPRQQVVEYPVILLGGTFLALRSTSTKKWSDIGVSVSTCIAARSIWIIAQASSCNHLCNTSSSVRNNLPTGTSVQTLRERSPICLGGLSNFKAAIRALIHQVHKRSHAQESVRLLHSLRLKLHLAHIRSTAWVYWHMLRLEE